MVSGDNGSIIMNVKNNMTNQLDKVEKIYQEWMNKTLACKRRSAQRNKSSPRTSKWAPEDDLSISSEN